MPDSQLVGVALVALGLLIVAIVAFSRLRATRHWLNGVTAEAVVVRSRLRWLGGETGTYRTKVVFTDHYGLEATASFVASTELAEGDRISIVYNPDKPKRAALASTIQEMHLERGPWRLPWWAWLLSVLWVVLGLLSMAGVGWN